MNTIPAGYLSPAGIAAINARRAEIEKQLEAKRAERKRAELRTEGRALAEQMGGWSESAMGELAECFAGVRS